MPRHEKDISGLRVSLGDLQEGRPPIEQIYEKVKEHIEQTRASRVPVRNVYTFREERRDRYGRRTPTATDRWSDHDMIAETEEQARGLLRERGLNPDMKLRNVRAADSLALSAWEWAEGNRKRSAQGNEG